MCTRYYIPKLGNCCQVEKHFKFSYWIIAKSSSFAAAFNNNNDNNCDNDDSDDGNEFANPIHKKEFIIIEVLLQKLGRNLFLFFCP